MRSPVANARHILSVCCSMFGFIGALGAAENPIPPAFGPYVNLKPSDFAGVQSFTGQDKIIATYYFYWYDIETKGHIIDGDGTDALTDHPATLEDFTYKSVRWHKKELRDMTEAGIDVVLPVFWGAPSEHDAKAGLHWSYAGLPPLVQAREELLREGLKPPRIGLFYDTSTLQWNRWGYHADLTTDYGKRWFYATIRDFFSMIPPKHWAMIDGRPLVLLYSASFAKKHDQGCVDYLKAEFPKEFGGKVPYLVRQNSWNVKADNTCAWGGALGLVNPGVASLGPGYDHSAVPGRAPLIVKRENGKFYENNWLKFLRRPSNILTLETWNEFHEGTDICESREYGRQYIELTRKYAALFKKGWVPPAIKGPYTGARSVSVVLGEKNQERGLRQVEHEDGQTEPSSAGGKPARTSKPFKGGHSYIYFIVDDSFKWAGSMDLQVEVEYYDAAAGSLGLEFDGSDTNAPFSGAYSRATPVIKLAGDKQWKSALFNLPGAKLANGQNGGADFRLAVNAPQLIVRQVTLKRAK